MPRAQFAQHTNIVTYLSRPDPRIRAAGVTRFGEDPRAESRRIYRGGT
jgi:hypothetical protein